MGAKKTSRTGKSRFEKRVAKQMKKESEWRYEWSAGFQHRGVPVDLAAAELAAIRQTQGTLNSRVIVEAARPEDAPLHNCFEWSDERCGELYRLQQANNLVRAIVKCETPTTPAHTLYVRISKQDWQEGDHRTEYIEMSDTVDRPDLFADAVARLTSCFSAAESSLNELKNLAGRMSIDADKMARIALAAKGFDAAKAALLGLH